MIAKDLDCVIVADHDATGLRVAKSTGKPYWIPPMDKEDFNDAESRLGVDALAELFSEFLLAQEKKTKSVLDYLRQLKA